MEEAPRTKLEDLWDDLFLEEKIAIVKDLASKRRKCSLYFSAGLTDIVVILSHFES
jgi:hypothetical protein